MGTAFHLQIIDTLLGHFVPSLLPAHSETLWLVCWISIIVLTVAGIYLFVASLKRALLFSAAFGLFYISIAAFLTGTSGPADFVHASLAWIAVTILFLSYRTWVSEKRQRSIRATLSKYVAPHILEELLQHPSRLALGGKEREITVLFADIRNFTGMSEDMAPTEVVRILNAYFSVVSQEIVGHGGMIDKYIGDAIMAFWGAPLDEPKQADRAVRAALAMVRAVEVLNATARRRGDLPLQIGIGIYTGKAVVGNIGSTQHVNYTAIGDTVNAASRIEGLTKKYGATVIISESTKNSLTETFDLTSLGRELVKGKKRDIGLFSVQR